ncbi:PLP-dependent transferase [Nadsonia fulvescens var. elongata DSM 6958]|uniref:aromatic-amino-acid transaminase n=1 Tax=Nadsonia fulvescens var. elongata DSM 6958 TaxID=857566 RepID=A0A1E3PI02_9ASCO|nr:PLP-dependent transferase [Nadsonia fulvescens var. elongata DSM 6958]
MPSSTTAPAAKPMAMSIEHRLSDEAVIRLPSLLKQAFKHFKNPGVISLGGGLPLPSMFSFNKISAESPAPPFAHGIAADPHTLGQDITVTNIAKYPEDLEHPMDVPLESSLQYGTAQGPDQVLKFLRDHNNLIHNIAFQDWDIVCTSGNTQGWYALLRTLCNPGDVILAEEFSFTSAIQTAQGNRLTVVPVKVDLEGIIPETLATQLDNWVGPKPKLLYTIPTGQNPTGCTLSNERRQQIYTIAQKHDIFIVEDEPYYFLQMAKYDSDRAQRETANHNPAQSEFIKGLANSFLTYDVDGRVIRLDSFSKVLAPGVRFGWIVAQKALVDRIIPFQEISSQLLCGFSQSLINGLLQRWGQEGYISYLIKLREEYTNKRDAALDAIETHLPREVAEWIAPDAGMFFWIKVHAAKFGMDRFNTEFNNDPRKVEEYIYMKAVDKGCLVIPGHWFAVNEQTNPPQKTIEISEDDRSALYFRGTFASASAEDLDKAIKIFGDVLREEFHL